MSENNETRKRGRPEGSNTRLAREAIEKAKQSGLLPHEILLSMARGEPQTEYHVLPSGDVAERKVGLDIEQRKDAAKSAAPYFAPKISTVEVISGVPDSELDLIIAQLASQAGVSLGVGGEDTEDQKATEPPRRTRVRLRE